MRCATLLLLATQVAAWTCEDLDDCASCLDANPGVCKCQWNDQVGKCRSSLGWTGCATTRDFSSSVCHNWASLAQISSGGDPEDDLTFFGAAGGVVALCVLVVGAVFMHRRRVAAAAAHAPLPTSETSDAGDSAKETVPEP